MYEVFDFDENKRADLSVIAEQARLGNITETTLNQNLTQFQKEIKTFKEKNKINYRQGSEASLNTRQLLANAFESVAQNDIERTKIQEYKDKIDLVVNSTFSELHYSVSKTLLENGLVPFETIVPISARLIANKASFKFKTQEIENVTAQLRDMIE